MWAQYKKTFLLTQLFIMTICIVLVLAFKVPWQGLVVPLIVMELAGIFGTRWAVRMKRSVDKDFLPPLKML